MDLFVPKEKLVLLLNELGRSIFLGIFGNEIGDSCVFTLSALLYQLINDVICHFKAFQI